MILAAAGASCELEAWAADVPTGASAATAASAAKPCTGLWDFIDTSCQLTWQGITVYGTIDAGVGWQSHGAPLDLRGPPGASYIIQKMNRSPIWSLAPNALSNSTIGIKVTEPIGGDTSLVFALDAGFDPYSFRYSSGPGSIAENAGVPLNQQTMNTDFEPSGPVV